MCEILELKDSQQRKFAEIKGQALFSHEILFFLDTPLFDYYEFRVKLIS